MTKQRNFLRRGLRIIAAVVVLLPVVSHAYQLVVTPRLSVNEEYTDNAFLTKTDKEHDFITGVSLGLSAELLEKHHGLRLSYDPQYVVYARFSENDTWRHSGSLLGWIEPTQRDRFEVSDTLVKTEDPFSQANIAVLRNQNPNIIIDPTLRPTRRSYLTNTAGARYEHAFGQRDSLYLDYSYRILRNDDPQFEDNDVHSGSGGLTWWFLPKWGAGFDFSYNKSDYEDQADQDQLQGSIDFRYMVSRNLDAYVRYTHTRYGYEDATEESTIFNPTAGVDYRVAQDLNLALNAGYFYSDLQQSEDQQGPTMDVRLSRLYPRGEINLSALGGYDFGIGYAANLGFQKFWEFGASGSYGFTRHVSGNLFGSYRFTDYIDAVPDREDEALQGGGGLTWQALQWMSLSLRYSVRSVDSTGDIGDYVEHRGSILVSLAPSVPYRLLK